MNLITRYIIKEHIGPFLFSLSVIMFVFVTKFIVQFIGRIFGKGLSYLTIFEFVYLNLAWMLALAVPMAVLISSLMAFGRLSSDNEITILKSTGINLYRIIRPALIWGAMLTVLMVLYNDMVLPDFNHKARLLLNSISQKKPTLELEKGIYLKLKNFNVLVQDIEIPIEEELLNSNIVDPNYPISPEARADKLKQVTLFDFSSPQVQRTVVADHGYLMFDKEREQMIFTLYDGEIHEIGIQDYTEYRRISFTKNTFNIPAGDQVFKRMKSEQRGDREMNISMMRAEVASYHQKIHDAGLRNKEEIEKFLPAPDIIDSCMTARLIPDFTLKPAQKRHAAARASRKVQSISQTLLSNSNNIKFFDKQIYKFGVEIHKKYSIPFACIVFILIGAPLGIRARKGSVGVGVTFSVGFFLLYWTCLIGGEDLADRRILSPALAMWFPNIIVGAFGLFITYRTVKETQFIQWDRLPKFLQFLFKSESN